MSASVQILPNEKELLSLIATGDEGAFTKAYHHYSPRIYSFVFNKTKSVTIAEEVVQEVFMKIWSMKEKVREIDSFSSYLFSMATNKTYDHLNKIANDIQKLNRLWDTIQELTFDNNVEEMLDFKESREMLTKAINELPEQRKKIYILNKEDGLSYDEIASKLNISKSTVSDQLVKASKFIREYVRNAAGPAAVLSIILFKILK